MFYLVVINFQLDQESKELVLDRDFIIFYDKHSNEICGQMILYKNKAIVDGCIVNELYFVWKEETCGKRHNMIN